MDSFAFKLADWGWALILLLLGICLALVRMVRQGDIERIDGAYTRMNARIDEQDKRINAMQATFHRLEIAAVETATTVKGIARDLEDEKDARELILTKLDDITQRIERRAARVRGDC
jgi:septal ring factor EnvC (AmiA/AmiB activator)